MGLVTDFSASLPFQYPLGPYSLLYLLLLVITVLVLLSQLTRPLWRAGSLQTINAPRLGVSSHAWFSAVRTKIQYIHHGFHMIHQGYREVRTCFLVILLQTLTWH